MLPRPPRWEGPCCCVRNLRLSLPSYAEAMEEGEPGVHRWHKCIPGSENGVNKLS